MAGQSDYHAAVDLREILELPIHHVLVGGAAIPSDARFLGQGLAIMLLLGFLAWTLHVLLRPSFWGLATLAWFLCPVLASLVLVLVAHSNFAPKYLMTAAPASILMMGAGISLLRPNWLRRTSVAIVVIGCTALCILHKTENLREDYRSACRELAATWKHGEHVVAVSGTPEHYSQAPLRHYLRHRPEVIASIMSVEGYLARTRTAPSEEKHRDILHVIYRARWYAAADLERIRLTHRLLQEGDLRIGIQHLVFEGLH
jgi:hypothetical protein